MAHRIVANEADHVALITLLGNLKRPFTVEWQPGRDRTRDQNALQWLWASEAANQLGDRTADEVQRDWKLRHGVPILRAESMEFRATYDRMLKPLSYEQKVEAMRIVDVTSLFKVPQMIAFLDAVQRECAEQGIRLTEPDADLASYQQRYRVKAAA